MRHQNGIKKLGRTHAHRKATLSALSTALIRHKKITTTLPKAKALRVYVEPILTRAKDDTTANRRQVFRYLQDKESIKELFGTVASAIGTRPGGYTRIVKLGQRPGDGTEMAVIELVDFNTSGEQAGAKKSTRRRTRRSTGKKKTDDGSEPPQAEKAPKAEKTPKTTPDTPVAQDVTPETASDVNAQAPGTPLDAPEPTEGGAAQNPEAGIPGEGGPNQFR